MPRTIVASEVEAEHRSKGLHNEMILKLVEEEKPGSVKLITSPGSVLERWAREYGFEEKEEDKFGKIFIHSRPEELVKKLKARLRQG